MGFVSVKSFLLMITIFIFSSKIAARDELEEIRRSKTRPNSKGPPIVVRVSIFLNQIFSIDVASMTIGLDLYLREEWEDDRVTRLVDPNVIFPLESSSAFWTPDTYFQNQIIGSIPSTKQGYIHIRSRGQVKSEKRIAVTASCPMDVHMFPFDTQSCALILESCNKHTFEKFVKSLSKDEISVDAFSNEDILLQWIRKDINPPYEMTPIGYTVLSTTTVERTRHYTSGNYSELVACITFRRTSGHYAILLFFPVSAIVLVAWIISWNYWDATFTDLVLLMISILLIHIFFRFRLVSIVSYITLTDFYIFICFILVFLCFCKVVLWKCLLRRRKKLSEGDKKTSSDHQYTLIPSNKRNSIKYRLFKSEQPYKVIHIISHLFLLIVFSICFVLLVLWPTIVNDTKAHNIC